MEFFIISMLNGLSYGLLLFMLSSGLTLIFSMMGVLNFAHASFYMLGAYVGYTISTFTGFWPALVLAPLVVGALGALFERVCLRRVHKFGHVAELLITFGLAYVVLELVQLIWGRIALEFKPPESLRGPVFTLINHSTNGLSLLLGAVPPEMCSAADATIRVVCSPFPATRGFMMLVALVMLASVWLLLTHTRIGLVIQAALIHPDMVEALGHNVPRVFMMVFGAGTALAALAGVIGGSIFLTEPSMAATVGSVIFVVVVGSSIFAVLTLLVLTFMMLIEGPRWLRFLRDIIPDEQHARVDRMAVGMYKVVKGYVNGQVILAALAALLITPIFFILDISYPIALMVIVFICGLIPMVGHTIGAVFVTLVALFTSPVAALIVLAYYFLYQQIENYLVQPRIQANSTNMSPLLVFMSVIIGVNFGGIFGGLVAIPVAGCLRIVVLDYLHSKKIINQDHDVADTTYNKPGEKPNTKAA